MQACGFAPRSPVAQPARAPRLDRPERPASIRPALQPRTNRPLAGTSRGRDRLLGGDVAQLGERLVRNEEVVGSIPIISTISNPKHRGPGPAQPGLVNPVRTGR